MGLALKDVLERANRKLNVSGMDKDVAKIVRDVITELHKENIYVGVAQAYRSKAEQDALYAQGRTKPGQIVTQARGGQSNHNFGVAVDVFVYPGTFEEAKFLEPSDARMKKIVAAMKKRGMKWGGDWGPSFRDYPHFELYDAYRGQKKPAINSSKPTSKPKPSTPKPKGDGKSIVPYPGKPLGIGSTGKDVERVQRAVGAEVTGKYTAGTKNKVVAYQKRKGLSADGIVGPASWAMMF